MLHLVANSSSMHIPAMSLTPTPFIKGYRQPVSHLSAESLIEKGMLIRSHNDFSGSYYKPSPQAIERFSTK